jgi:hypothetical protein
MNSGVYGGLADDPNLFRLPLGAYLVAAGISVSFVTRSVQVESIESD